MEISMPTKWILTLTSLPGVDANPHPGGVTGRQWGSPGGCDLSHPPGLPPSPQMNALAGVNPPGVFTVVAHPRGLVIGGICERKGQGKGVHTSTPRA